MDKPYEPVSCDYHDELEAAAMHKQEVELEFDAQGVRQRQRVRVADVFTRDGGEFVKLESDNGQMELRLDEIVSMRTF
ncbi:MAG: Rho-binding antiterminator [Acidobacteriota bacterium]